MRSMEGGGGEDGVGIGVGVGVQVEEIGVMWRGGGGEVRAVEPGGRWGRGLCLRSGLRQVLLLV